MNYIFDPSGISRSYISRSCKSFQTFVGTDANAYKSLHLEDFRARFHTFSCSSLEGIVFDFDWNNRTKEGISELFRTIHAPCFNSDSICPGSHLESPIIKFIDSFVYLLSLFFEKKPAASDIVTVLPRNTPSFAPSEYKCSKSCRMNS